MVPRTNPAIDHNGRGHTIHVHVRPGRITAGQKKALRTHNAWLLPPDQPISPMTAYARQAPLIIEIGCGKGETIAWLAERHPENNYLGVEVYKGGVGSLLQKIHQKNLTNIRVMQQEAAYTLEHLLPTGTLTGLMIFFPDPWPKKRHHKRRLINNAFLRQTASRLKEYGRLYMATDCDSYARHIDEALADSELITLHNGHQSSLRPLWRPVSRYEKKAHEAGRPVREWIAARL